MLARFCLYGFLKNLRLFEPFLVLALRERELSFAAIGGLIAVREIVVNVAELPTGALADGWGRKRCMVFSMVAYLVAFVVLAQTADWWLLALGMVAFGAGDAFRSGTHKAMIYTWLRSQGREGERTRIYGYTRSWSQIGSALSALLAILAVGLGGGYEWVFWASCLPTALNLINLATYPASLDRDPGADPAGWAGSWRSLCAGLRQLRSRPRLRRLIAGSMAMEGSYGAGKYYLQPLVQAAALAVPLALALDAAWREAVLVGGAYTALHLLTASASRSAHRVEAACGGASGAARRLALVSAALWLLAGITIAAGWWWLAVPCFLAQGLVQNWWRPIQIGRYDEAGDERLAATTLSLESQGTALATAALAPLLGWLVDSWTAGDAPWPVLVLALPAAAVALGTWRRTDARARSETTASP